MQHAHMQVTTGLDQHQN